MSLESPWSVVPLGAPGPAGGREEFAPHRRVQTVIRHDERNLILLEAVERFDRHRIRLVWDLERLRDHYRHGPPRQDHVIRMGWISLFNVWLLIPPSRRGYPRSRQNRDCSPFDRISPSRMEGRSSIDILCLDAIYALRHVRIGAAHQRKRAPSIRPFFFYDLVSFPIEGSSCRQRHDGLTSTIWPVRIFRRASSGVTRRTEICSSSSVFCSHVSPAKSRRTSASSPYVSWSEITVEDAVACPPHIRSLPAAPSSRTSRASLLPPWSPPGSPRSSCLLPT